MTTAHMQSGAYDLDVVDIGAGGAEGQLALAVPNVGGASPRTYLI